MDVSNKTGESVAVDSRSNISGRSKTDVHYNFEKMTTSGFSGCATHPKFATL